jgi:glycosyltransferase involved in cell wall biosynthesis
MACALPVLITDKVNIWSEIEARGAGLVRKDDAAGVEDLLAAFLAMDPEARRKMGEAARLCFVERFEIGRSARDILQAIEGAIA